MWQNLKTQKATTQKLRMWQLKTQNVITQILKMWQNSNSKYDKTQKTQNVKKFRNSKCDNSKTQNGKKNSKTQNVTKLKNSK